jgi:hypothetical protein
MIHFCFICFYNQLNIFYVGMVLAVADRPCTRFGTDISHTDLALLDSPYDNWNERNASTMPSSTEPLAVLSQEFRVVADEKPYRLYERCDRTTKWQDRYRKTIKDRSLTEPAPLQATGQAADAIPRSTYCRMPPCW